MNDERQQEQNRTNEQFAGFRGKCGRAFAELAAAFGVDAVQRCCDESSDMERLTQSLDAYREMHLRAISQVESAMEEIDRLRAERKPRDNGDGTVTQLLPVTYRNGEYGRVPCNIDYGDVPANPEPVTWVAPLADGIWHATGSAVERQDPVYIHMRWDMTAGVIRGLSKPERLGTYLFKNGVGTLQANQ